MKTINLSLSHFFISLLLLDVCIFRYFGLSGYVNYIIAFFAIIGIAKSYCYNINKSYPIFFVVLLLFYFNFNCRILDGSYSIISYNLWQILPSLLIFIYSCILISNKMSIIVYLNKYIYIIFAFFYINIFFIVLQINGYYQFSGFTNNRNNSLAVDMVSGLFGYNGIPMMTLFLSFFNVYVFHYIKFYCKNRFNIICIWIPLIVFYIILPLYNDNKGFYLVQLLFAVVYYLNLNFNYVKKFFKSNLKKIGYISIFLFLIVCLFTFVPSLSNLTSKIIQEIRQGWEYGSSSHGSNERIGMIQYALSDQQYLVAGHGVGNYTWTEPYAFGFWHYGQSDLGTFLCLGGLAFVILLFSSYISSLSVSKCNLMLTLSVLFSLILLSIYTQVFTVSCLMISFVFFLFLCCDKH